MDRQHRTGLIAALCFVLLFVLLAGCVTPQPGPAPTASPAASATRTSKAPLPTITPARQVTPQPSATSTQVQPSFTEIPSLRPASGWKLFSNPDFVKGVAAEHQHVWAATSGGVLLFDVQSEQHQLFTTSDGLVDIQANDIIYCPLPEEQVFVAHEPGVLSVYSLSRGKWDQLPITFEDGGTLDSVKALTCDPAGERLVVAARSGVGVLEWKTSTWRRIDSQPAMDLSDVRSVAVRGQNIWVAAGRAGGYLIIGSTAYPLNSESGLPSGDLMDVAVSDSGFTWMAYPNALVRYKDRVWTPYTSSGLNGIPFESVDQVEVGTDGKIWISSAAEGACPFDPQRLQCTTIYPDTPGFPLTDLTSGEWGTFVGTNGDGVRNLKNETVQRLAFDGGQLSGNQINALAEDASGRLWVATDRGVDIVNPSETQPVWEHLRQSPHQLVSNLVSGLQPAPNGMWFTYQNLHQASFFDNQNWSQLDEFSGLTGQVLDMAVDHRGYLWFATDQGVNIWDGLTMRGFDSQNTNLPTNRFQALLAQESSMWVGTDRGLLRYSRFTWELLLPEVSVLAIAQEPTGDLLLGTDHGLIHYRDGQAYFWIINLGKEAYLSPLITSIVIDRQNNVWAGSRGDGLFFFNGQTWQHFTTANGLPANNIQAMAVDRAGGVWIAAMTGAGGGALVRYIP